MPGFFPIAPRDRLGGWWILLFITSIGVDLVLFFSSIFLGVMITSDLTSEWKASSESNRSQNWPVTQGYIDESFVSKGRYKSNQFVPMVRYSYKVGDAEYTGDRIVFSVERPRFGTREEALNWLKPLGEFNKKNELTKEIVEASENASGRNRNVEVFYDPANPQNSTLRKEYQASDKNSPYVCLTLLLVFFIIVMVISVRSWYRFLKNKDYKKDYQGKYRNSRLPP